MHYAHQVLYVAFRVGYLWDSFSNWHWAGFALTTVLYLITYFILAKAASPKFAPIAEGGDIISGGADLDEKGMTEYTWDMLYVTIFVQLATCFLSDVFWVRRCAHMPPHGAPRPSHGAPGGCMAPPARRRPRRGH